MNENDLSLARAARFLVRKGQQELATMLLSSRLTTRLGTLSKLLSDNITVHIIGSRDMYELLWNKQVEVKKDYFDSKFARPGLEWVAMAFRAAVEGNMPLSSWVSFKVEYGAANRTAAAQTELYQYVFGEDPVGQQVQVLDVGQHSSPTRQLIVSPVPVLPVTDLARDAKLCFVAMPFAAQFRDVYDRAIHKAVTAAGLTCRRGDDISQPGAVLTQIWLSMLQSRLIIADVSGGNGNVLYELGLAHVLGHEAILLTQNINNVPFDLRHQRTIVYSPVGDGLESLRSSLTAAIQSSLAVKR